MGALTLPSAVLAIWTVAMMSLLLWMRETSMARNTQRRLRMSAGIAPDAIPARAAFWQRFNLRWINGQKAAALRLRAGEYGLIRLGSLVVPGAVGYLVRGWAGMVVLGVVGFFAVWGFLSFQQARWLALAERELPDFLRGVASAMRAGSSFQQAMALVGKETPPPLGTEIERLIRRESLGYSMDQILKELVTRVPSRDLDLAVTAITIQREIGGALAGILDNIVQTIVERQRLKNEVRALTAQGRMSGWVLTVLPIGIAVMIWFSNPTYLTPLFHTKLGYIFLGYGLGSLGVGTFIIQRMTRAPDL